MTTNASEITHGSLEAQQLRSELQAQLGHFLSADIPGRNRTEDSPVLSVNNDADAAAAWVASATTSKHTFVAYRKEVLRLLLWGATRTPALQLSDMDHNHIQSYLAFIADPQPADVWIGPPLPRTDPRWKPFNKPLAASSRNYTRTVINSLFSGLVAIGYLRANPVAFSRSIRSSQDEQSEDGLWDHTLAQGNAVEAERFLRQQDWELVQAAIDALPDETPSKLMAKERARFITLFLYYTGARRSELAEAMMRNIINKGQNRWYWRIYGKGGKIRAVPIVDHAMGALLRWRQTLGLYGMPCQDEATPLLRSTYNRGHEKLSIRQINHILRGIFDKAADLAGNDAVTRDRLQRASTH